MFFEDIRAAWKTGKSFKEIKEARDYFADNEMLDEFFKSGWSIDDVKQFKEMVETTPEPKTEEQPKQVEQPKQENVSGLEVPENMGMMHAPQNVEYSTFKNLGQR